MSRIGWKRWRVLVWLAAVAVAACLPASADDDASVATTYDDHVKPILRRHCLKCHGNDEQNADLNLQSYATLMKGGSAGVVVKPGRPDASVLFQAITAEDDAARMPPESPPIPRADIAVIQRWIQSGLRETSRSKSLAPQATITFDPSENAAMKPAGPPPLPMDLPPVDVISTARQLPVLAMASSPWAPLLAVSGYEHVRLFHTDTGEALGELPFEEGIPHVLRFSRNGGVLLAAGGKPVQSGGVVLFDVRTGKRLARLGDELDAVMAADISPDQQQVALGGSGRVVKIYSTTDAKLLYKLTRHTDWITSVAFSPDGKQLATADRAGGIFLWDASSGGILFSLASHKAAVRALAWRGDSKLLASAGDDGALVWWNVENGFIATSQRTAHPPPRPSGVFGQIPNGVLAATFAPNGFLLSAGRDQHARWWDASGQQKRTFKIDAATPTQVAVSQDGNRLIVGDASGGIHFFDKPK